MRFYAALLYLYPTSFRREYGAEMRAVFARRQRDTSGGFAWFTLWLDSSFDVVGNAAAAHWDLLRQDLRYTARTLSRAPGFALTAVLVTALGIGANTAAFSVADFVLIRPLPFAQPDRLVRLWEAPPGYSMMELSPPNYRDWKETATSFEGMGAFHGFSGSLVGEGDPQRVTGSAVTGDLLPLLGVPPLLGRYFTAAEARADVNSTIVLSYGLWQRAFGGDRNVIGRRVLLGGVPRVVVGVMPPEFNFPNREAQLWITMPAAEQDDEERDNNWFEVVARLKPGVTPAQAQSELTVIAARLEQRFPKENEKIGATVNGMRSELGSQARLMLLALCGAALCVLLIACANLANLLLARALARRRELDVRAALGAGRERLVRQLVTESLVLATIGGALGVLVAILAVPMLTRLVPVALPIAQAPGVDLRVLAMAALLTALTGVGFGVVPALRAARGTDLSALGEGARSGGGRRARLRSALVIVEVMACVVLLVSSGLLLRALQRIHEIDPGFRTEGVITMRTELGMQQYDSLAKRLRFYTPVLTAARALPGVRSAAYITAIPMAGWGGGIWPVGLPGAPETRSAGNTASLRFATPQYFAAMGIPIRRGREIEDADVMGQPMVAVISESFVKRYWPGEEPIGKRFKFAFEERTVVGVVGDVKVRGLERVSEPQVYLPYKQVRDGNIGFGYMPRDLVIRTTGSTTALLPALRSIIKAADPQQPISNVQTLTEVIADQTASRAVQVRVLGAFALIAFLLAAVGIHGLLAFSVSQRKQEFGVRMALGAQRGAIVRMVLRQGVMLALAGVLPGIFLAYAAGRGMEALLAGVKPGDAATFAAAAGLCVLMTLAGSLLPVLRAVRTAPATVLRAE